jgi:hypothetical protein
MASKLEPEFHVAIEHLQTADFLLKEKKAKKFARLEGRYIINETMHALFWMCDNSWKKVRGRLKKYGLDHLLDIYLDKDK